VTGFDSSPRFRKTDQPNRAVAGATALLNSGNVCVELAPSHFPTAREINMISGKPVESEVAFRKRRPPTQITAARQLPISGLGWHRHHSPWAGVEQS
jgi:hypothetical protein